MFNFLNATVYKNWYFWYFKFVIFISKLKLNLLVIYSIYCLFNSVNFDCILLYVLNNQHVLIFQITTVIITMQEVIHQMIIHHVLTMRILTLIQGVEEVLEVPDTIILIVIIPEKGHILPLHMRSQNLL